jgi:hypothetical protein
VVVVQEVEEVVLEVIELLVMDPHLYKEVH